jgi:CheY-like chemotaxis protein
MLMFPIPRILIVDDNPDHRLILAYQLAKIGTLDIREAGDGRQALAGLATVAPDLIFMNLGLPLLDGWEAIRHIRALAAPLWQVPVIAVTAHAGRQEEQDACHAGCDIYLVKPVLDWGQVRQTVTALLARSPRP